MVKGETFMASTSSELRQGQQTFLIKIIRGILPDFRRSAQSSLFADLSLMTLVGFALFLALSLFSFQPSDASYFSATWPPSRAPQNYGGSAGASLAAFLFFFTGYASFIIPVAIMMAAIQGWHARQAMDDSRSSSPGGPLSLSRTSGLILLLAVSSAGLATSQVEIDWRGFPLPAGGLAGHFISAKATALLGRPGSLLTFSLLMMASLILMFEKPFLRMGRQILGARLKSSGHRQGNDAAPGDSISPDNDPVEFEETMPARFEFHEDSHIPAATEPDLDEVGRDTGLETVKPKAHNIAYNIPPAEIFQSSAKNRDDSAHVPSQKDIEQTANLLIKTFNDFGVSGKVIGYQPGPVVTVFEFQPDAGVKQSRVLGLIDDLALSLKVDSIFINPVPGKRALGVQVPNTRRETVYLGDIIGSESFQANPSPLVFAMGKSLSGQPVCADLTSMPHLLMAGATGAGKSVAINSLICSVVMKSSPADVRMILVDPKMLELSVYEGIPHLLMPVITEPDRASHALKWAAAEMERRYRLMQLAAVRNIAGFNQYLAQASPARLEELRVASGGGTIEPLPYILLVIDELADLMLTAPKDVESSIQRLAQKARASGIHMVLATQRPSVDIITGVIKANLPCRLSFQVVSKHDSRTILDQVGAEKLLGRGDMLFQRPGSGRLERIQGALVGDEEVLGLVAALKASGTVAYDDSIMNWIDEELQRERAGDGDGMSGFDSEEDPKYADAMQIAQSHGVVSASFLQRHLKIGYNRAARIVEHMERCGLVAKADGAKPRRWLGPSA